MAAPEREWLGSHPTLPLDEQSNEIVSRYSTRPETIDAHVNDQRHRSKKKEKEERGCRGKWGFQDFDGETGVLRRAEKRLLKIWVPQKDRILKETDWDQRNRV